MTDRDAAAMIALFTYRLATDVSSNPLILRMGHTTLDGQCDLDNDRLRRFRQGMVGGAALMIQVPPLEDGTLILL